MPQASRAQRPAGCLSNEARGGGEERQGTRPIELDLRKPRIDPAGCFGGLLIDVPLVDESDCDVLREDGGDFDRCDFVLMP